jgi:hypothetical protein
MRENMRTYKERKNEIKNMPTEKLRHRFISGSFGELRPFVEAELITRDLSEKSDAESRKEGRDEESLSIARKALFNSKCANIIAIIAAIIAAIAIFLEVK